MTGTEQAPLAITGSTGHLGARVARELSDAGIALRLLARTPSKAPRLPGAVAVESRYANDDTTRRSLSGIDTLFMVSGSESADRLQQHYALIDAAAASGVRHIVYTSFAGAAPDAVFTLARDHWATEQHIIDSGMAYTLLRDNFYIDFLPDLVGEDGVIRGPSGDGAVAAVTREDIARVAATVLRSPTEHAGHTYDLTGPEALTMTDVARILQHHRSEEVSFHNETIDEAYASRRKWEAPQWQYDAWVSTYTAIAAGELATVTRDVEVVTGRPPLSLSAYLSLSSEGQ